MAMDEDEGILWAGIAAAVGIGVATLARKATAKSWTKRRGFLPGSPGDGQTTWREAALFAAVTGVTVGLSRLAADRLVDEARKRTATKA